MSPDFTMLLAPNASLLTGPGTNTVIFGRDREVCVIDPADRHPDHLAAITQEVQRRGSLARILITHGHADHLDGAYELRAALGGKITAYNPEGVADADEYWTDQTRITLGDDYLRALYTPGHRFDHLCFYLEKEQLLFAGDVISSINTVVIIPPEGDMHAYMQTLKALQGLALKQIVPGHGPVIDDPQERIKAFIEHRQAREDQILSILTQEQKTMTIPELVAIAYAGVNPDLHQWAVYSVEAHLLKLLHEGRVIRAGANFALPGTRKEG
jgi:glyoxylase-like metal-dependent hydrolase (beta-lactamase superfamily II)